MSTLESNTTDIEDMRYKHHLIMCVFNSIIFECCHGIPIKSQIKEPIHQKVVKQGSDSIRISRPGSQTEGSWSQIRAAEMEHGLHTLQHKIRHRRSKRRAGELGTNINILS